MYRILIFICVFASFNGAFCQINYTYQQPLAINDGWKTQHIDSLGLNTIRIPNFLSQAKQGANKLHSMLVIQNNHLIIEEYFNGQTKDDQQDLRSVTKSIRSLLLGIAIDKGLIESIDDPIFKYLKNVAPKNNVDDRKSQITIRHLTTMSTGLDCNDWDKKSKGQEDRVYTKDNWVQYTLDLPMINDPGAVSNYCSMGVLLLAEVISEASGMSIDAFAERYLFEPLQIRNLSWGHTSKKQVIASGKRLYMSPRDLAKIGQLVLQKGVWKGQQLISESWIEESLATKTSITGVDYGFLWWNIPMKLGDEIINANVATGNGGQYIMVLPDVDMVAIFTGGAYNSQEDKLPFVIMNQVILPTFKK